MVTTVVCACFRVELCIVLCRVVLCCILSFSLLVYCRSRQETPFGRVSGGGEQAGWQGGKGGKEGVGSREGDYKPHLLR